VSSWHEFITMGGYALYVWPAYALGLVVILYNAVAPIVMRRRLLRQLEIEQSLASENLNGEADRTRR